MACKTKRFEKCSLCKSSVEGARIPFRLEERLQFFFHSPSSRLPVRDNQLTKEQIETYYRLYPKNAHLKRSCDTEDLVVAVGQRKKSTLLDKAILISRTKRDRNGRPYQVVSSELERLLGISGSIQRSIPPRILRTKKMINNLKRLLGLK